MLEVAVIIGSLRQESETRRLAQAIGRLAIGLFACRDLSLDLPLYNDDLWSDPPAGVAALKAAVESADAVLFVTPEHNRSIPAALKNAIDWGSRPRGRNSWSGKPAGIIGGSIGKLGAGIAQAHLRSVLVSQECRLMGQPEVYFQFQPGGFDADGRIADGQAEAGVRNYVAHFHRWIEAMAGLDVRPNPNA